MCCGGGGLEIFAGIPIAMVALGCYFWRQPFRLGMIWLSILTVEFIVPGLIYAFWLHSLLFGIPTLVALLVGICTNAIKWGKAGFKVGAKTALVCVIGFFTFVGAQFYDACIPVENSGGPNYERHEIGWPCPLSGFKRHFDYVEKVFSGDPDFDAGRTQFPTNDLHRIVTIKRVRETRDEATDIDSCTMVRPLLLNALCFFELSVFFYWWKGSKHCSHKLKPLEHNDV